MTVLPAAAFPMTLCKAFSAYRSKVLRHQLLCRRGLLLAFARLERALESNNLAILGATVVLQHIAYSRNLQFDGFTPQRRWKTFVGMVRLDHVHM